MLITRVVIVGIGSHNNKVVLCFFRSTKTNNYRDITRLLPQMENISKIWYGPLPADSPYVKPFRLYYIQNEQEKNWDLLKVHDSVSIVIYNKTRNKLVFVKQFRPGDHSP